MSQERLSLLRAAGKCPPAAPRTDDLPSVMFPVVISHFPGRYPLPACWPPLQNLKEQTSQTRPVRSDHAHKDVLNK